MLWKVFLLGVIILLTLPDSLPAIVFPFVDVSRFVVSAINANSSLNNQELPTSAKIDFAEIPDEGLLGALDLVGFREVIAGQPGLPQFGVELERESRLFVSLYEKRQTGFYPAQEAVLHLRQTGFYPAQEAVLHLRQARRGASR